MKSTATNTHRQNEAQPARSQAGNPSRSNSSTGYLGQLAATINGSPHVQAQRKLAQELQNSPRAEAQQQLATEINGGHAEAVQPPAAPVVQLVSVKRAVTGVTHLVRKNEDSIFEGKEVEEVRDGDIVEIETDRKFTSRRGPNQERYSDIDREGPVIYEWYEVQSVNDYAVGPDVYIRDRTFRPLMAREKLQQEMPGLRGENLDMAVRAAQTALHIYGCTLEDLDVTSSSGATLTFIAKSGGATVMQYIMDEPMFKKIRQFYLRKVHKSRASLEVRGMETHYDLRTYIAQIVQILPEIKSILVERVLPLNQLFSDLPSQPVNENRNDEPDEQNYRNQMLTAFIQRNSEKLIWDINKAIHGLHQEGYSQGDVRLDNIGIKNGNFVLFDYSGLREKSKLTLQDDFTMFEESLKARGITPLSANVLDVLSEEDDIQQKMIELQLLQIKRYL
jgi:tRNA A-37 threonylcarbamoyl transferase component Bud32